MSKCGSGKAQVETSDPCCPPAPDCGPVEGDVSADSPVAWFRNMVETSLKYAEAETAAGKHLVGIMCEYTPRELIMAAGGIPVCLCGGSTEMIPAAEEVLPANLCPLIKSTFGFHINKANPFLEMAELIVAETTCDGKKKMYELLSQTRPIHVLELPQKSDEEQAMAHWVSEIRALKSVLEKQFDTEITDGRLRESIAVMNRERQLKRSLAALMEVDCPPLTGRELLDMKSLIACMPDDMAQYERALTMLGGRELDPRASSRVRVLLTGVPVPHGAERVIDIIEDSGGLVVCQENCTGLKPVIEDVDEGTEDPLVAMAEKYLHLPCSVMTPNERRMTLLRDLVAQYRPQCVVELVWQTCVTYDIESFLVKKLVEEELQLPYLRIETDYSPSDSARIAMRVEALVENVVARRS